MLLHPDPQEVLVVGLGSGITLGAVEQYPIKKVDLLEIEPAIIEAARYFDEANNRALDDKRLRTIVSDGRSFLLTTRNKYDVISSEPSNPWVKGNANLFTKEYYQLAREHLKSGGIFLQWVQNYGLDTKSLKSILATFQSVFPQTTVWSPLLANDLMLIGTKETANLDFSNLSKKFHDEKIIKDLERISLNEPSQLLGLFIVDKDGVKRMAAGSSLHTDNFPILEFSAPFALAQDTTGQNLEELLTVKNDPFSIVKNLPEPEKKKIQEYLALKENIFKGKIALDKNNIQEATSYLSKALEINPNQELIKKELARTYFNQAEILYSQGNWMKAEEMLQKTIELNPSFVQAYINLGAVYYNEGDLLRAASEWAQAKELDPENEVLKENLKILEKQIRN